MVVSETAIRGWIEAVLGERLGDCALQHELRDGVVLCNLLNGLQPGICPKPSRSRMPVKQLGNVAAYLTACVELGVAQTHLFDTDDLLMDQHFNAVLKNVEALAGVAQTLPGFTGPDLGSAPPPLLHCRSSETLDTMERFRRDTTESVHPPSPRVQEDRPEGEPGALPPRRESMVRSASGLSPSKSHASMNGASTRSALEAHMTRIDEPGNAMLDLTRTQAEDGNLASPALLRSFSRQQLPPLVSPQSRRWRASVSTAATEVVEGREEAEIRAWVEGVLGERLGLCSLQQELKDGVGEAMAMSSPRVALPPALSSCAALSDTRCTGRAQSSVT